MSQPSSLPPDNVAFANEAAEPQRLRMQIAAHACDREDTSFARQGKHHEDLKGQSAWHRPDKPEPQLPMMATGVPLFLRWPNLF